jgi:hypothetical protein
MKEMKVMKKLDGGNHEDVNVQQLVLGCDVRPV